MKIIIEQIVEINVAKKTLKKVKLCAPSVDMPPFLAGDVMWYTDTDNDRQRRSKLLVVHRRDCLNDHEHYVVYDVITPELQQKHKLDAPMLLRFIGDEEEPAPEFVEIAAEKKEAS